MVISKRPPSELQSSEDRSESASGARVKNLTLGREKKKKEKLASLLTIQSITEVLAVSMAMCIDRKVPGQPLGAAGQPAMVGQDLKSPHSLE